ncbi:hypothetical protein KAI65_05370 [Candidatus Parcubacteria bacterium]|nr:hypothetical protein [Candidatus Parcubacteria bacterium]
MTDTNTLLNDDLREYKNIDFIDDLDLEHNLGEDKNDDAEDSEKDEIVISKSKAILIKKLLDNIRENSERITKLLSGLISSEDEARISIGQMDEFFKSDVLNNKADKQESGRIIEGVFDGENMIGPDGKEYSVPANYASKSKLIEGDILKLTITSTGTFVYKQIGPIERIRVVGILEQVENGSFIVTADNKRWKVLTASVTYYKGQDGDEIIILVPKTGESNWAAVENIVRKNV